MGDMAAARSTLASTRAVAVPMPTGPETVGTRVLQLNDSTREDPFLANGTKRELLVRFWYPASLTQPCVQANYTSPKVWGHFSELIGVQLPEVTANSCVDAPLTDGIHPVVVFTHGYTGTFTDYTFLFEELAPGLGDLVGAFSSVRKQGGELKLLDLGNKFGDLMRITKLRLFFDIMDDETLAVKSFSQSSAATA